MSSQTFIDLSRWQFATTAAFHMTFPALTVGLSIFLVICYGAYCKTGNPLYLQMFRFWRRIFGISFALGIVVGIVLTFELGLNWGNYARAVGPILGPMICMEALTAFFLEAGFFGILVWGEGRVSKRVTMVSTCIVALGALLSTAWILDANSWMQTPAGYREVNGQFQPTNWFYTIFNPAFNYRFPHMVLAVLIASAWFIAAIGAYYLLRRRALPLARKTMSIALLAAAILLPIQLNVGDNMATYMTAVYQPDKLIAAEGNFNNGNTGWNLFTIPDQAQQRNYVQISLPNAESVFDFHNFSGNESVPGIKTIPQNLQPTVAPVFWGFHIMIYGAWAMFSVAFIGRHHAAAAPPVHRTLVPAAGAVDAAGRGDRDDRRLGGVGVRAAAVDSLRQAPGESVGVVAEHRRAHRLTRGVLDRLPRPRHRLDPAGRPRGPPGARPAARPGRQ